MGDCVYVRVARFIPLKTVLMRMKRDTGSYHHCLYIFDHPFECFLHLSLSILLKKRPVNFVTQQNFKRTHISDNGLLHK